MNKKFNIIINNAAYSNLVLAVHYHVYPASFYSGEEMELALLNNVMKEGAAPHYFDFEEPDDELRESMRGTPFDNTSYAIEVVEDQDLEGERIYVLDCGDDGVYKVPDVSVISVETNSKEIKAKSYGLKEYIESSEKLKSSLATKRFDDEILSNSKIASLSGRVGDVVYAGLMEMADSSGLSGEPYADLIFYDDAEIDDIKSRFDGALDAFLEKCSHKNSKSGDEIIKDVVESNKTYELDGVELCPKDEGGELFYLRFDTSDGKISLLYSGGREDNSLPLSINDENGERKILSVSDTSSVKDVFIDQRDMLRVNALYEDVEKLKVVRTRKNRLR